MPTSGTTSTHSPPASGSMLRGGERAVVLGAIVAVILAAVAGVLTAPTRDLEDPRLSTYLAGPHGAKGLAQTLRRLGTTVEQRRRPYFDLVGDSGQPRRAVLLAFLDIDPPTARELAAVRDYVTHGGRVFVAGVTEIESCFGYRSRRLRRGAQADSSPVVSGAWRLPRAARVLARIPAESLAPATAERLEGDECAPRLAARVDTLLSVRGGRPLALRLGFPTGGEAVLLTVSGLRRRLGRAGALSVDAQRSWLAALELGLPTATGRNAVRELQRTINQPGGPERALAAAQAVEDVWEELRPQTTRAAS